MAKERVQVQGLGDAVPGIQPTIQRGGQYAVQVQRAGRNKLQDLAGTLSQINPVLEQYAGVAEQEAQMFEEELARKSPEEVQAMLKATEGELDKQVRRGAMGWLTSPLNQKRKLRAVGQASSRLLMEQVYNRLDNPEAGDEDLSTREVINLVQQNFVNSNEALFGSMFAQEGLQESVNPQILPLVRQYDAQKNRVAKGDTAFGTTNVFYELAKDGSNLGEYDEETTQALLGSWENLSAFSANEQRDILGKVFENLAKNGMEEKADSLLLWASKNIKIGASKMTELEYDGYSTMIERTAEVAGNLEEKNREDLVRNKVAEFQNAHTDIELDGNGTYNGQVYTNIDQLITAVKKDEAFDDDGLGLAQLRNSVDDFIKTDIDPKEFRLRRILSDPLGPSNAINISLDELGSSAKNLIEGSTLGSEILLGDDAINNIINSYSDNFQLEVRDEVLSLISSPAAENKSQLYTQIKDFVRSRKKEIKQEQFNALNKRIEFLSKKEKIKVKTAASKTVPERGFSEGAFNTDEEDEEIATQSLRIFADETIDSEERRKAYRELRKTSGLTTLRLSLIAKGEMPKVKQQQRKNFYSIRGGFGGTIQEPTKRVEYTKEERDEALNKLVQIEAAKGEIGEALLTDQPILRKWGIRFDPELLNSKQFPLISKDKLLELIDLLDKSPKEREANDVFRVAKDITKKIGEDDVLSFIRNQRSLFKFGLKAID